MAVAARRLDAAEATPARRPGRAAQPRRETPAQSARRRTARPRGLRVTRPLLLIGVVGGLLTGIVALGGSGAWSLDRLLQRDRPAGSSASPLRAAA